ncbi:LysR substrate-binding domain-containing protein [Pseudomonas sp. SCB32]|uniref:LysR substrate-binding domain-containing protein n=1 Tax=Pseudomonas sp. SCB32 TaxID=2653853 RepID=UPI0012642B84|nr:LysR substrate-binding domain-containing protein [Pseudomonas sp. SCB32]
MDPLPFDLNHLRGFVLVVEHHGFTAAANALGVPKSRISRYVAELEAALGTRLLQRNSRKLALTEAGSEFYGYSVAMLGQARAAHVAMQHRSGAVAGTVRLSVSVAVADLLLTHVLPPFLAAFPQVNVALQATNRMADLIDEGLDLAVRGMKAAPESSDLIQSRICTVRWGLVASPDYLAKIPIHAVADLAAADALLYRPLDGSEPGWTLYASDDSETIQRTRVRLQGDSLAVLKSAALAGCGIGELPLYACRDELADGSLLHLLPGYRPRFGRLVLLFPSRRGMTPAARMLADHLRSGFLALLRPNEHLDHPPNR